MNLDSTLTSVLSNAFDELGPSSLVMSGALGPDQLPIIWGPPPSPTIPIPAYNCRYIPILLDLEGRTAQDDEAIAQDELDSWSEDDDEEVTDDVEME